jgi:hypothetical protein
MSLMVKPDRTAHATAPGRDRLGRMLPAPKMPIVKVQKTVIAPLSKAAAMPKQMAKPQVPKMQVPPNLPAVVAPLALRSNAIPLTR